MNPNPERPDDSDLTPLIVRLPKERFIATSAWMAATGKRPEQEEREPVWIGILMVGAMMSLPLGALFVFLYWLGKQAGLWE